jgi:hypothetical protein
VLRIRDILVRYVCQKEQDPDTTLVNTVVTFNTASKKYGTVIIFLVFLANYHTFQIYIYIIPILIKVKNWQ